MSHMCDNCGIHRRMVILAKLYSRYNEPGSKSIRSIVMWTIGTSLKNTDVGRKTLSAYWKYFRARMNKKADWDPLFRVVEIGTKGKRLHIHFLNSGYLLQHDVLTAWREVTRENSNVEFSKRDMPAKYAFRYVAKYLSKDASKYTFLGKWYGKRKNLNKSECFEHGESFIYYQSVEDKKGMVGQTTIE